MPIHLDAADIALRLLCAVMAGAALGANREAHGHAAGLRTTILVAVAAALVMVEANILLSTHRPQGVEYTTFDVLRLPLGLLSGVGFLGAGAIVRRGGEIRGITTAATIWFTTMVGLAIGSGQLALGAAATVLALAVLWILRLAENRLPRRRYGRLGLAAALDRLPEAELRRRLEAAGLTIASWNVAYGAGGTFTVDALLYRSAGRREATEPPPLLHQLAAAPGVNRVEWKMASRPG